MNPVTANKVAANYGCTTCLASFDSSETQRAHMRENWHVSNLKRRISSLPPISVTEFQEQELTSDTEISLFQQSCTACEQHYTNKRAWRAHLKSRNHTQKSDEFNSKASLSDGSISSENCDEGPDEEETFSPLQCLFCNVESTSMDINLTHMSHTHSFLIPDAEFLIDLESLLSYLFAIVSVFHECLFCGSLRSTKLGVQDHMRAKGHCKFDFEDDKHELQQFYDYSEDGNNDGDEVRNLLPDEDELRLPSGKTLGHRSRIRHLRHNRTENSSASSSRQQLETELETMPESTDRRITMRAGTSTSMIGVPDIQQRALMAVEKKMMQAETRARNEYHSKVEKGGNKQKRYKVSSIGKKAGGLEKRLG